MKSVQFCDNIEILYTHPNECYDRKCVPEVKVNFKIATEIMQYRLDMSREYKRLLNASASVVNTPNTPTTNEASRLHNYPILA